MKTSILLSSLFTISSTLAAPIVDTCNSSNLTSPFYLVTASSSTCNSNSSLLPSVSAISLFDPFRQPNFLLRTIERGYFSLPNFTLTDGVLHTPSSGPFGTGNYIYNSTPPVAGQELQFAQSVGSDGGLSLLGGFLLAVNGSAEGWGICPGALGQRVIQYKGTDASCNSTYIQAVSVPPY
ncbi:hypothetical protein EJ08DRAFT_618106 [Tothia fuscella]|uniref:Uncharacterized protein n=1 Tax=Tothia fuscella TaxID=1048955 RepID=A0A9P4NJR9_9PEZI|nr:hypothetical protein EJ08DRAFT_618106 [Tothia fuscella]